jgi:hypothetical protein
MGGACGTYGEQKNTCGGLVIKTEEKRLFRKSRLSLEGNIKMVDFRLPPRRNIPKIS